mmetsp:Transcript_41078/g.64151  ORF Transcript_41078/g.64151 Transcript_41078/m.64151 type:complete len:90 (-) Transcript_41078:1066-1335(-)
MLKIFVVEVDVLGQLVVSRIEHDPLIKATAQPEGTVIQKGDVLVEIDGESVRGKDPGVLNCPRSSHVFRFGRRTKDGAQYFEVTLSSQS